jgi:hypothetical protein
MKRILVHGQKIFILWFILNVILTGCSTQEQTTVIPSSSTPRIIPTSSFGVGDIASISLEEAANLSNEEIVRVLVSQWLESYKTDSSNPDAIVAYKVKEVSIQNPPADVGSGMIAIVTFAIQPVGVPNNWASLPSENGGISEDDPWWHLGATFKIILDGENLILRTAFGWGT